MKRVIGSVGASALALTFSGVSVLAAPPPAQPTSDHQRLGFFVGEHKIEGKLADGTSFTAEEKCDWFDGKFAVVCHAAGTSQVKSLSIISYDPAQKAYGYYTINSSGMVGIQRGRLHGDVWTFLSEPAPGTPNARIVITPRSQNAFGLKIYLQNKDGKWSLWEDSTYTKK